MAKTGDNLINGDLAVYKQIEGHLRRKIDAGEWASGSMLPSRRDLAKQYGVSPLTVERAITNLIAGGLLRADDRRGTFVMAQPDRPGARVAEPQSSKRTIDSDAMTIGMVGSLYLVSEDHLELNNYWVRQLVQSLEHGCAVSNARTRFFNRVTDTCAPLISLSDILNEACDAGMNAIALMGIGLLPEEVMDALSTINARRNHPPIVVITSGAWLERPVPHVCYDNYAAGYEAARHLLAHGCRSQMIFAPVTARWATERIAGIEAAVRHFGEGGGTVVVQPGVRDPWQQDVDPVDLAYRRASDLLDSDGIPDAVIALQDQSAFGFMRAAEEHGYIAGRDYAIIGFDDEPHARTAQLSSMRPPIEMMGTEASRLIMRSLHGEPANYQINLQWNLIARASSDFRPGS
ncbi:MAG TPA: GntR family transcriptional regulator [Capsulimonadaceae bacterium]|jgi:DNA-binding LacI/PurR family transcriptional regulator